MLTSAQAASTQAAGPAFLELTGICKEFSVRGRRYSAVEGVSLSVREGEFLALIGPSGCGKTTVLNIVAGLIAPTAGVIRLGGQVIHGPGTDRGVVFQHHGLLPWMTAYENVRFALDAVAPEKSEAERRRLAHHCLDLVGLRTAHDKRPHQLSGGMKQRVGIARAFAADPRVLLLDEPFGALDALTKTTLQDELVRVFEQEGKTVLMVTHDIDEALYLADRIAVFSHGPAARIRAQFDSPFPRPRLRESVLADTRYLELRRELLTMLIEEMAA